MKIEIGNNTLEIYRRKETAFDFIVFGFFVSKIIFRFTFFNITFVTFNTEKMNALLYASSPRPIGSAGLAPPFNQQSSYINDLKFNRELISMKGIKPKNKKILSTSSTDFNVFSGFKQYPRPAKISPYPKKRKRRKK